MTSWLRLASVLGIMKSGDSMRAPALAIASLLLLTSCTGEPTPIEPKPSATAKPSVTPPAMPKTANEDTPSGAATFVGYWVSTFNYAAQTGDAGPMKKLSKECKPCTGYADDFESLQSSERPKALAWSLSEVRVGPSRDPIEVVAKVQVLDEDKTYPLTFVLNSNAPFKVMDIYDRDKS